MERRTDSSIAELLRHEEYTPEELSRLLGDRLGVIRHAAFVDGLGAHVAGHDIISLQRGDVVDWLAARAGTASGEPLAKSGRS